MRIFLGSSDSKGSVQAQLEIEIDCSHQRRAECFRLNI